MEAVTKALMLLGAQAGLRAAEMTRLEIRDVDFRHNTIVIRHPDSVDRTDPAQPARVRPSI
jgi:integrase